MNRFILILVLLIHHLGLSQAEFDKGISGKTLVNVSFYHLGSYSKSSPFVFLEQEVNYNFHSRFSAGVATGINLYPAALALPIRAQLYYNFKIGQRKSYIFQSIGTQLKIASVFFKSNLYRGGFGLNFKINEKLTLNSEMGYSYLWDRYGGKTLSFYLGIGLNYNFNK